jgi:hypothetical protein
MLPSTAEEVVPCMPNPLNVVLSNISYPRKFLFKSTACINPTVPNMTNPWLTFVSRIQSIQRIGAIRLPSQPQTFDNAVNVCQRLIDTILNKKLL